MNLTFLLKRFTEPSTYVALSVLGSAFGLPAISDETGHAVMQAGVAMSGLAAVFMSEKSDT